MLKQFMLAVVGCCLATATVADQQAVESLNKLLEKSHSITAKFHQTTLNAAGNRTQKSEGQVVVSRPNQFRWEVTGPFPQLVISDGVKVWVYDPDLEQVTVQKLDKQVSSTPALLLSGDVKKLADNFEVVKIGKSTKQDVNFKLTPKAKDSVFEALRLSFNEGVLANMKLTDSLGAHTTIDFTDISTNKEISADEFTLPADVLKNADVIEE
ncbi:outer membrane lipoprotein chaperone LolA [Endozoicomonas sp. SM1973]|uniref:Outer-membrane lipoprotein carrier protein n=1 Tax=Spartinivicinus marinus TaxID=2994442 RepID=A0A853I854_9GAMM|nr:outer membrane lipoprotein chaperone LolA [Spartinivicinus marinus]NYZ65415.1 outer membrane lipoprotein chaperone LolA [Spartinivicinus marinus]